MSDDNTPSDGLPVMQVFEARFLNFTFAGQDFLNAPLDQWIVLRRTGVPMLLLNLVKLWAVPEDQWADLLTITPEQLTLWRAKEDDPDLDQAYPRAKSLLRIHAGVQRLIQSTTNPMLWKEWLHNNNKSFEDSTPIDWILQHGHEKVEGYVYFHLNH